MAELPAAELKAWRAYERVEPWGEQRQDYRMGRLMALLANLLGQEPGPGRTWSWRDFYAERTWAAPGAPAPPPAPPGAPAARPARQTPEQMQAIMASFVQLHHASGASRKGWAPGR